MSKAVRPIKLYCILTQIHVIRCQHGRIVLNEHDLCRPQCVLRTIVKTAYIKTKCSKKNKKNYVHYMSQETNYGTSLFLENTSFRYLC